MNTFKIKNSLLYLLLVLPLLAITSCSDDDDAVVVPTGVTQVASKTYALGSVANPDISGTAKFIKNSDGTNTIELQLQNTPDGGMHPAHIHFNTALEGGDVALTLGTVDGDTGFSTKTFTTLNDETPITYEQLLAFDGYINVHLSADELETLVAQGDIGQNELSESITYNLAEVDAPGISGTAVFTKRNNGEALAVLTLTGTPDGGMHPAHIHMGSVATAPGAILFSFEPVNGTTGISAMNVTVLDGTDTPLLYDDIVAIDGYINVHESMDNLGVIVAQGDIGINN